MSLQLTAPQFSISKAEETAKDLYGIEVNTEELRSERDQNFKLVDKKGNIFVLKISNSAEKKNILDLQNKAMDFLNDKVKENVCPSVLNSLGGEKICLTEDDEKRKYYVRLLSFLDGEFLADKKVHTDNLL